MITLPGFQDFQYDFLAPPSEREEKTNEALERWLGAGGGPQRTGAHLLIDEEAWIDFEEWSRLLAERDQTPVTIIE